MTSPINRHLEALMADITAMVRKLELDLDCWRGRAIKAEARLAELDTYRPNPKTTTST